MNKSYQEEQIRKMLMDPAIKSGIYLIDTDLSDVEIEHFIKNTNLCSYAADSLIPTSNDSSFDLFVIGLSYKCDDDEIIRQRNQLVTANDKQKEIIVYNLLILMLRHLCPGNKLVLHVQGELDLKSLCHEDICKLKLALTHHNATIVVISKIKNKLIDTQNQVLNILSFKEFDKYKLMENRLEKVHISYKHDDNYNSAIDAIKRGLDNNGIAYTIDVDGIKYRDSIEEYEKEIGQANRVIMFVIPSYLKSLDCMFEMTQIFKIGKIKERIFPIVDMGLIARNGDGLKQIKDYWQKEKIKKSEQIQMEPGGSTFVLGELTKIDNILKTLDDIWDYLVHINTGEYKELIANDAAMLITELQATLPSLPVPMDNTFIPSGDTMPAEFRTITQNGDKSLNIGNNYGEIIIN